MPGAAERQKTLAAQDGKCALCGCGLTGACELDHVAPVRQAFAGSVQTLQALCSDCRSKKTLRESAQPTSLESRVAPGVMEYVRSPKLPPLVFEAQTCAKDSTYVGVDVVRCRRNGLANAPFPCPFCARRTALSPWTACCRTWALWRAAATRGSPASICCRTWGPAGTQRFRWPRCWTWASAAGTTLCWVSPRGATWTRRRCGARWSAWTPRGGRGAHGQAQRERDDSPVGAQHGGGLQRAQQQQ